MRFGFMMLFLSDPFKVDHFWRENPCDKKCSLTVFGSVIALLAGVLDREAVVVSRQDSVTSGDDCGRHLETRNKQDKLFETEMALGNAVIVISLPSKGSTLYVRRLASSALGT